MQSMFSGAFTFQAHLSSWNVTSVWNMESMFKGASAFQADLSYWKTGKVMNMRFMFDSTSSFDRDYVNNLDPSSIGELRRDDF